MTNAINTSEKNGLMKIGYVKNNKTCMEELNKMLRDGESITRKELDDAADAGVVYLNGAGYPAKDGKPVTKEHAKYIYFLTGKKNCHGKDLICWYERKKKGDNITGVYFGTFDELKEKIRMANKPHLGKLYFKSKEEMDAFVQDLVANAMKGEPWAFPNKPSRTGYEIMESIVENVFERLLHENASGKANKLVVNKTGRLAVYNSYLQDNFAEDILILVEMQKLKNGDTVFFNPKRITRKSALLNLGFDKTPSPEIPKFFSRIDEIIFHEDWDVIIDYDTHVHIFKDRLHRFPTRYVNETQAKLARSLEKARDFAISIAKRNHQFIVPMYRPQENKIQLLMPIYLDLEFSLKPDFALVLTPDEEHGVYIAHTILELDQVYKNARLIMKPNSTWLNPENIF